MGNNFDTRKNLSIIKIPIKKSSDETVELINFLYPEQKKFNTIYSKSQYDGEGIVSIKDDLIIFTKNKLKKITEVYSLPKTSGNFEAKKISSIDVKSIVTGSDYNNQLKLLALTSTVDFKKYFLILIKDFSLENNEHQIETYEIPIGKTQVEAVELKHRIEDAIEAVRAAQSEGVVPGGGVALLRAAQQADCDLQHGDQRMGFDIILKSVEAPIRQMSINAGLSPDIVVDKVRGSGPTFGFNFMSESLEDFSDNGVIDPVKVTRTALENAVSVASTLITTNYAIIEN